MIAGRSTLGGAENRPVSPFYKQAFPTSQDRRFPRTGTSWFSTSPPSSLREVCPILRRLPANQTSSISFFASNIQAGPLQSLPKTEYIRTTDRGRTPILLSVVGKDIAKRQHLLNLTLRWHFTIEFKAMAACLNPLLLLKHTFFTRFFFSNFRFVTPNMFEFPKIFK